MITITKKVFFSRGKSGRRRITHEPPKAPPLPLGRVPRISKLVALAHRFAELIRSGQLSDMTEIARVTYVTQARITQIMKLLHLAPDIQEELLFLPRISEGRDPIHEKMLRPMTTKISWQDQRAMWQTLKGRCASTFTPDTEESPA